VTGVATGLERFARYAVPPNLLGYCGPGEVQLLQEILDDDAPPLDELAHAARMFEGAFPYLELIGGLTGRDPFDEPVVEAYWLGSDLLESVDTLTWGNSVDDRFRGRAGTGWDPVRDSILARGVPTHAFHVFCVYPWVGLLRSGAAGPALTVLDRCRISWGEVVAVGDGAVEVRSARLVHADDGLRLGPPSVEAFSPGSTTVTPGDAVSLHWGTVCERLTTPRLYALRRYHDRHLAIANRSVLGVEH
jgi:hypothetical protein